MRHRPYTLKFALIGLALAAGTARSPIAAADGPVSASTVDQIRQAADAFADEYARKIALGSNEPILYFNRITLDQVSRMANRVATQSSTLDSALAESVDQTYRLRDLRPGIRRRARWRNGVTQFARYSSFLLFPVSFAYGFVMSDSMTGDDHLGGNFVRDIGGYAPWAVSEKTNDWELHAFRHVDQQVRAKLRQEMMDVFFTRLDEHGIGYDRKDREGWLFSQLDGHPLPNWTELTDAEKARWADEYRNFLKTIADQLRPLNPEGAREVDRMAVEVSEAMPGRGWIKWRSETYRNLGKRVADTFKKLAELDRRVHFAGDPQVMSYLSADLQPLIENADLFAPETYDYLTISRFQLPDAIVAYLPRLRELGGKIELTHTPSLRGGGSDGKFAAQIEYGLKVTFADGSAPLRTPFTLGFDTTTSDVRLLAATEAPRLRLSFAERLQEALLAQDFAGQVNDRHAARFPVVHCPEVLSKVGAIDAIEAQVAAAGR